MRIRCSGCTAVACTPSPGVNRAIRSTSSACAAQLPRCAIDSADVLAFMASRAQVGWSRLSRRIAARTVPSRPVCRNRQGCYRNAPSVAVRGRGRGPPAAEPRRGPERDRGPPRCLAPSRRPGPRAGEAGAWAARAARSARPRAGTGRGQRHAGGHASSGARRRYAAPARLDQAIPRPSRAPRRAPRRRPPGRRNCRIARLPDVSRPRRGLVKICSQPVPILRNCRNRQRCGSNVLTRSRARGLTWAHFPAAAARRSGGHAHAPQAAPGRRRRRAAGGAAQVRRVAPKPAAAARPTTQRHSASEAPPIRTTPTRASPTRTASFMHVAIAAPLTLPARGGADS